MLRWWDRRTAAQVHLMAMVWVTALVVIAAVLVAIDLYPLVPPLLLWLSPAKDAAATQLVLRRRLGGKQQVRLLRRALSEVGGVPSGADAERWRAYISSRLRHHSRFWRRITIGYTLVVVAAAAIVTRVWQVDPGYLVATAVVTGVLLLVALPFIVQSRRDNPRRPDPIADMRYLLDHLPEPAADRSAR